MLTLIVGLLASTCLVVSSLSLERRRILFLGMVINALNALQYLLLDQPGALAMVGLGFIMSATAFASLKWEQLGTTKILVGFLIAYPTLFFASGTVVSSLVDVLPLLGMMLATGAFFMRNILVVKSMFLTVGMIWLTFQFFSGAYGGIPGEIITMTGNLVSIAMLVTAYRHGRSLDDVEDLASILRRKLGTRKTVGQANPVTSELVAVSA